MKKKFGKRKMEEKSLRGVERASAHFSHWGGS